MEKEFIVLSNIEFENIKKDIKKDIERSYENIHLFLKSKNLSQNFHLIFFARLS